MVAEHSAGDTAPADGAGLSDALATAILGGLVDPDQADHLALVRRAARAEHVARQLLMQSVESARTAGHSWATIGAALGMSRQAAQQRFGAAPAGPDTPQERWLGPVTAFDEMHELDVAGRLGWHTVGAGMLRHRMVRTATQWEHRRVIWPASSTRLTKDGWQIGCRSFPWIYLVRDTGRPAQGG